MTRMFRRAPEEPSRSRALPHNWDTEKALLGGLLLNAADYLDEVRAIVAPGHFHRPSHAALFELVCALADRGQAADPIACIDAAEAKGEAEVERIGGRVYLAGLVAACSSIDSVPTYARRVRLHWERRDAIVAIREAEERLMSDPDCDPSSALAGAQERMEANVHGGDDDWVPLADATGDAVQEIQRRAEHPGVTAGIPTGWSTVDRIVGGWRGGRVYVIGARPKMGKSAYVQQTMIHAARQGHGVGMFSLEMDRLEIGERALAQEARADAGALVRGEIDESAWRDLLDADEALRGLPVYIADRPAVTMAQIRAKAKRLAKRCQAAGTPLGLLVIDYLQLMGGDGGGRNTSREQVVAALSRGVKLLAKEMHVAILLLSQLNRALESRADKRPMPSDLRESGAIEQDADGILFLYRDEVYNPDSPDKGICEVIVSALRGGQPGTARLAFQGKHYRFVDLEEQRDARW
jgi:replicative DNA helicase